jgi:hypothetical protein
LLFDFNSYICSDFTYNNIRFNPSFLNLISWVSFFLDQVLLSVEGLNSLFNSIDDNRNNNPFVWQLLL